MGATRAWEGICVARREGDMVYVVEEWGGRGTTVARTRPAHCYKQLDAIADHQFGACRCLASSRIDPDGAVSSDFPWNISLAPSGHVASSLIAPPQQVPSPPSPAFALPLRCSLPRHCLSIAFHDLSIHPDIPTRTIVCFVFQVVNIHPPFSSHPPPTAIVARASSFRPLGRPFDRSPSLLLRFLSIYLRP